MKTGVLAFLFSAIAATTMAQAKVSDKAVIKTPQAQCEEGKDYLESILIRETGVTGVNVNYHKGTTTVTWLTDRTTLENLKVAISYLGFDADDVTADEDAFKRIPACCKKPLPKPKPAPVPVDTVKPKPVIVPVVKDTVKPKPVQPVAPVPAKKATTTKAPVVKPKGKGR